MTPRAALLVTLALGLLGAPLAADAQPPAKLARVGMLMPVAPDAAAPNIEAFRRGLRERGWVEGQNITIEYRYAEGKVDPLLDSAADLVRLKVDVIVTWGTPAARAAKKTTSTIPIVMASGLDPVATGLVASLARPGGNVTGVSTGFAGVSGKNLELLREVVPGLARVAVLTNPDNLAIAIRLRDMRDATRVLHLQLQILEVRDPGRLDGAFATMARERVGAVHVMQDLLFFQHRHRLVDLAAKSQLPAMYDRREYVDAGGLMSYGANFRDNFRRAAGYVDRILKGAKPGDLAVEQPRTFELVINLKTAKALGLTIPEPVLLRADEVIQ